MAAQTHKDRSKSICTGTWLNLTVLIRQRRERATAAGYWAGLCVVSYPGLVEQIRARTWLYSFTEAHQNALLDCSYNQQKSEACNGITTSVSLARIRLIWKSSFLFL